MSAGQRRRRWPNITATLGQYFVIAGSVVFLAYSMSSKCMVYRHPGIILSYLQFSLFRDNRKKLNNKKSSNISALSEKTFVDIRNRRFFNVKTMQQTLALHSNKHLQKIRPYNIIKYGQCMIIHNITVLYVHIRQCNI